MEYTLAGQNLSAKKSRHGGVGRRRPSLTRAGLFGDLHGSQRRIGRPNDAPVPKFPNRSIDGILKNRRSFHEILRRGRTIDTEPIRIRADSPNSWLREVEPCLLFSTGSPKALSSHWGESCDEVARVGIVNRKQDLTVRSPLVSTAGQFDMPLVTTRVPATSISPIIRLSS